MYEPIPILKTTSALDTHPGPAAYDTRGSLRKQLGVSIGNRYEEKEEPSGPELRALPTTIGTGKRYTISIRTKELEKDQTPGPNFAAPQFGSEARHPRIGNRIKDQKIESTPGPADYSSMGKNTGLSFSFHGRKDRTIDTEKVSPGPAAYDTSNAYKRSPRIHIGSRITKSLESFGPGPGAYDIRGSLTARKYTNKIGIKLSETKEDITPGPSDYNSTDNLLANIPKLHIGYRLKTQQPDATPGPYSVRSTFSSGPKYSIRPRTKDLPADETPGVSYVPPAFGSEARKFQISPRLRSKEKDPTPGPSDYSSHKSMVHLSNAPTFHGRKDRTIDTEKVSPGPAQYSPRYSSPSPRYSISNSGRGSEHIQKTGEYVLLGSTFDGPKYSMSSRNNLPFSFA